MGMTGRSSTAPFQAAGICAAQRDRGVQVGSLEEEEPGEDLLGLGERAVAGQTSPPFPPVTLTVVAVEVG